MDTNESADNRTAITDVRRTPLGEITDPVADVLARVMHGTRRVPVAAFNASL